MKKTAVLWIMFLFIGIYFTVDAAASCIPAGQMNSNCDISQCCGYTGVWSYENPSCWYGIDRWNQWCTGEQGQMCPNEACWCSPSCEGKICGDDGCGGSCGECSNLLKEESLNTLTSLNSMNKASADALKNAIIQLKKSLGNQNPEGDSRIRWIDDSHIACKDGQRAFDYEKKAVEYLKKVNDLSLKYQTSMIIKNMVDADRILALTEIQEAPESSHKTTALSYYNKGESATDPMKKIDYYKKAWQQLNKNCATEMTGMAVTETSTEVAWLGAISIVSIIALVIVSVTAFNRLSEANNLGKKKR